MSNAQAQLKDLYPVLDRVRQGAHLQSQAEYQRMYQRSVADPAGFWAEQARSVLTWERPFDRVMDCDFQSGLASWFLGGKLNAPASIASTAIWRSVAARWRSCGRPTSPARCAR